MQTFRSFEELGNYLKGGNNANRQMPTLRGVNENVLAQNNARTSQGISRNVPGHKHQRRKQGKQR